MCRKYLSQVTKFMDIKQVKQSKNLFGLYIEVYLYIPYMTTS